MFKFIMLVFIVASPDGAQYKDIVGMFPTMAECQKAEKDIKAFALKTFGPEAVFFSTCVKPRALGAVDT